MVIAYLRVSTSKQVLANQKSEIERFAEARSIKVDKWVTEVVSGCKKQKDRKIGRLIKRLGKGDVLIVTEVSRLSRTLTDIMVIMGKCVEKGIILYCVKEGYTFDNTINSKVLCFAFGLVAEIERNLISMRTKEALALRKAEGVKLGRRNGASPKMHLLEMHNDDIEKKLLNHVPVRSVCREYGVSTGTFYNYVHSNPSLSQMLPKRG